MFVEKCIKEHNSYQAQRLRKLKKQLKQAQSYAEWKEIALKLDEESGVQEWKYDNSSPYFDAEIIAYRLTLMRRYRIADRMDELVYLLREGFNYDIANIAHPLLFTKTYVGTKKLIEDYIDEVSSSLNYIVSERCNRFSREEKIDFFQHCQRAYGQPALMFSGGATLGLFHTGVCKALLEQDLMPKVLSGSSAGAIMTAMLGVSAPNAVDEVINGENFFNDAFKFRPLKQVWADKGGFADVMHLKDFLIRNLGNVTFEEAFERSGLHINIAVAPYDGSQEARVMNSFTSPDLLVWSAVLASCAVPVLFPPVRLTSKRYDGQLTPYMGSTRWVDGSVRSDFPQEKMARLYNLNYTIASQVNPHIVPFMQDDTDRYRQDMLSWPERVVRMHSKIWGQGVMDFARERAERVPSIRRMLDYGYGVVNQRYYGNVNIFGDYHLRHYSYMFQNPQPHLFRTLQREGERATWPKISSIEMHARIGKTLQNCLQSLTASTRQQDAAVND